MDVLSLALTRNTADALGTARVELRDPSAAERPGKTRALAAGSSSATSRLNRLAMAATGHRKLQRGAWLATPRMRSGTLRPTPHRAEDTGKVVSGFRNRLKYLVVSRPFPQCHAVGRRTGTNGGMQSNQTQSLVRRHDGRRPVHSRNAALPRFACDSAPDRLAPNAPPLQAMAKFGASQITKDSRDETSALLGN